MLESARGYRSCHKCKFLPPSPLTTIAFMCFQLDQTFLYFFRIALAFHFDFASKHFVVFS